jgi:prevent-host-death family protein
VSEKVGNITTLTVIDTEKAISAADANRKFSQLLRDVREGQSYVVTSHGRPVARLVPVEEDRSAANSARRRLLRRLRSQPVIDIGRWTRDELYD